MKYIIYRLLVVVTIFFSSCGTYSFTGASIPASAKTISIQYFPNKASTVQPILSQTFAEKLKDLFVTQTNLILTKKGGDLNFTGYISKYEIKPMAIKANEIASKNRLTISINVNFINKITSESNFEQIFSRYKDYESSDNISDIEEALINEICDELVEDIFNQAVVNW